MLIRNVVSSYALLLSLGAFYLGIVMLSGRGIFAEFPPEWVGVMPFGSWLALALFGMIVFGLGNAAVAAVGWLKKRKTVFVLSIILGLFCLLCTFMPVFLLGEWYLPTVYLFLAGTIQVLLGCSGFIAVKSKKEILL